ncbi:MAG: hypothetical protein IT364_08055 [Candidatus Hydrogenedentes bacterium]|nr:hypothetical protein [Candidatus Hydrogenedentota bacterium]
MDIFQVTFDAFGVTVVMAVFVIVLFVCLRILPEMGFDGFSRKALAFCVAVLSAMGLMMLGPGRASDGASEPLTDNFILLPYAALGLTLLLLPLLFFLFWCCRRFKGCFQRERKPAPRTKERHASPLPKPPTAKDSGKFNQRACGDRQRVKGPTGDQLVSGKRRFKQ